MSDATPLVMDTVESAIELITQDLDYLYKSNYRESADPWHWCNRERRVSTIYDYAVAVVSGLTFAEKAEWMATAARTFVGDELLIGPINTVEEGLEKVLVTHIKGRVSEALSHRRTGVRGVPPYLTPRFTANGWLFGFVYGPIIKVHTGAFPLDMAGDSKGHPVQLDITRGDIRLVYYGRRGFDYRVFGCVVDVDPEPTLVGLMYGDVYALRAYRITDYYRQSSWTRSSLFAALINTGALTIHDYANQHNRDLLEPLLK